MSRKPRASTRLDLVVSLRRALCSAALVAVVAVAGCASTSNLPQDEGLHPRLTPTSYIEEGSLVALAVDVNATTRRDKQPFIPLAIALGNKSLRALTLNRESFTLVDEAGNRYPMATVEESRKLGSLVNADGTMSEFFLEVAATQFQAYAYQPATFFPVLSGSQFGPGRGTARERIELGQRMWTFDIIYFPHPKDPIVGKRFELWMTAAELEEPIFVKFRVKS